MISKSQIRHLTSLHLKKNREEEQLFFVEGAKMVNELLNSSYTIHSIYATEEWLNKHSTPLEEKKITMDTVTDDELKKISALTTPQQVIAIVSMPEHERELNSLKGKLTLILDEVKDPGNLGTIIRIADWFGIENIICSENTVEQYNSKVVQATMGSLFRVKLFYDDVVSFLTKNQSTLKLPVYAAAMKGSSVYDAPLGSEGFIILGNESAGVGQKLDEYIDHALTIPSYGGKEHHAESLNVAVASAIVCSEFRRRSK